MRLKGLNIWGRFRRDPTGAAMVEFTIVLPILAVLLLASIEIASYFWARSRVTDAVAAVGDLTTQSMSVSDGSISAIFGAADAILAENPMTKDTVSDVTVRLTSALACKCGLEPKAGETIGKGSKEYCYTALWSHEYKVKSTISGYKPGEKVTSIPSDIAIADNDTVILVEFNFKYRPKLHFVLSGAEMSTSERFYMRPRFSDRVTHVGSQAPAAEPRCLREADG
ncbi:MAG: pilus assembly protein [Neomegalonema sp.]|nr:pilus assembly protein [Neomegalonema sp.]